jgi:hypothetical protein
MPALTVTYTSLPPTWKGVPGCHHDPGGKPLGILGRDVVADENELVAAEPRERVTWPHHGLESFRQAHQQAVAGGVPQTVIDDLELVDVEEQHAHVSGGPASAGQRTVDAFDQQLPVRQACQRVMQCLVREHGFGLFAGGDVLQMQEEVSRPAVRVGDEGDAQLGPDRLPVGTQVPLFFLKTVQFPVQQACERGPATVVDRGKQEILRVSAQDFFRRPAENLAKGRIHLEEPTVQIGHTHADLRPVETESEIGLGLLASHFSQAQVRDVHGRADDLDRRTVRGPQDRRT